MRHFSLPVPWMGDDDHLQALRYPGVDCTRRTQSGTIPLDSSYINSIRIEARGRRNSLRVVPLGVGHRDCHCLPRCP